MVKVGWEAELEWSMQETPVLAETGEEEVEEDLHQGGEAILLGEELGIV